MTNGATSSRFEAFLDRARRQVDRELDRLLPRASEEPRRLHTAVRYSVFAGGKRLRPALCLLACDSVSGACHDALSAAAALEMIHTFSLIHDDLPGMDDDDWRRGRRTNHKVFGEGMAILAGDALLSLAFETLATRPTGRARDPRALLRTVCVATGPEGMIGGQALDLLFERKRVSFARVLEMHRRKTAMLIRGSLLLGAQVAGADARQLRRFADYGERIGVAFQITDDLLNERSTRRATGKSVRSDRARGKATAPSTGGAQRAEKTLDRLLGEAARIAPKLGRRGPEFESLTAFLRHRSR
ncbi:MAG TPA: farnesyl diphosphate synthase [Candidatus Eisenbacteria bacterium]|jgi:geranylgeranyl diphosphate synthase type II|nr:farnesyl diphosphate synthase [Candidatus Eisenbacteria bacterium]